MQTEVIITTVAVSCEEDSNEDIDTFIHQSKLFKKLLQWENFDKISSLTSRSKTGFFLKTQDINGVEHLILCHQNSNIKNPNNSDRLEKSFLVKSFFESDAKIHSDLTQENQSSSQLSLEDFYDRLRESHETDDLQTGIPEDVQHQNLRPLLRPYQRRGVKWMLKREISDDYVPNYFQTLRSKFRDQQLHYNKYTQELFNSEPEFEPIPPGGLLTDEMGLGKTVEILALLLMNPRRIDVSYKTDTKEPKFFETHRLRCICSGLCAKKKKLIQCNNCGTSQHFNCVFLNKTSDENLAASYLCPLCWKTSEALVEAKTTIIVTPASIKNQWKDEIDMHISDKSFKTLMYTGIASGWVSPNELALYDVVIVDFNTLSKELYFSDSTNRSLRKEKKFEYPPSPLSFVRWWRVVLDEAQMVENKNSRPSLMVKQLPAVNRWATTGTPIEKDSIRCLYGLLFFLNYYPYSDQFTFDRLCSEFQSGRLESQKEMIEILSKVMWRTSKRYVEHEINIPKQAEVLHEVKMTDLQKYFYVEAHNLSKPQFVKNVHDYLVRSGPPKWITKQVGSRIIKVREQVFDPKMKEKFLYELNNVTLKIFLEPLRSLRQDCTIPSIFQKTTDQTRVKQTLKPEQLHEHLLSKTSIEAKSSLRTICSSLNGIAAIKIANDQVDEAVVMYQQVLKLANQHTGVVCVDSMLQIHVYQGLLDLTEDEDLKEKYRQEMGKLEWKYISNYYEKVKDINHELAELKPDLIKTFKEYTDKDGQWWREIILERRTAEEDSRLMEVINLEVFSSITENSQKIDQVRSINGVVICITEWYDKIHQHVKDVRKRFKALDFIVKDLKPSNEMSAEDNKKLDHLAKTALGCHLNLLEDDEELAKKKLAAKEKNRKKKGWCELCKLKMKINELECVLFNKNLAEDNEAATEGTWNARLEEKLLKSVFIYAKRNYYDEELISMGNNFFKYLEELKSQFKLLAKLWVEVNYTISAYDELNMCRMRMQIVSTPEEITEEDARYRLKILRCETYEQLEVFSSQKQEAEVSFTRLNGRLKYLAHLKEQSQPTCPICSTAPKERYFMLICGHSLCAECFFMLGRGKPKNRSFNCPLCRTVQDTRDVYAVTCSDNQSSDEPINGSYSPKIDEILRTIIRLMKDEPEVKILIFSHWDSILQAITPALDANNINWRSSLSGKFLKQGLAEFKTQDITCLLLNLKFGGKGLNIIEATHVFLVEPILNADEELQAIGRVHRIGQTRETFVHKFITLNTIESTIFDKITSEKGKWMKKHFRIRDLEELLDVPESCVEESTSEMMLSDD